MTLTAVLLGLEVLSKCKTVKCERVRQAYAETVGMLRSADSFSDVRSKLKKRLQEIAKEAKPIDSEEIVQILGDAVSALPASNSKAINIEDSICKALERFNAKDFSNKTMDRLVAVKYTTTQKSTHSHAGKTQRPEKMQNLLRIIREYNAKNGQLSSSK